MISKKMLYPNWISVHDALPLRGERVLVLGYNWQNRMDVHVSICTLNEIRNGIPLWSRGKGRFVSHWMPLPEVPDNIPRRYKND